MTCIIGLVDEADAAVYMAGDACAGNAKQYTHTRVRAPKVFTRGPYLLGYTTSFRMGQILQHAFDPPDPPNAKSKLAGFLATTFMDAAREALKAGGYARREKEAESAGEFLLAVGGRLFRVGSDYQVSEPALSYEAVGCGCYFAMGAMHASAGAAAILPPVDHLLTGLRAATEFNAYVLPPYTVVRMGADGKVRTTTRRR